MSVPPRTSPPPQPRPLTPAEVHAIERAELEAWRDMYRALPPAFTREFRPELREQGDVAYTRCRAIPFVHFNSVLNLGLGAPATEEMLDALLAAYEAVGIARVTVLTLPYSEPAGLPGWLTARGFTERPGWDRVFRTAPLAGHAVEDAEVAFVDSRMAPRWTRFLDRWYGLPTAPWLQELVGRDGWHHAVLVQQDEIRAARSMYLGPQRTAWLGIEAPVPGVMAPGFADDDRLVRALLGLAARRETQLAVADLAAVQPGRSGPAYDHWEALGFTVGYRRAHYVRERAASGQAGRDP
ncbi:MAG: hypothetical protein IPF77_12525 [Gemmatimonadetes bacterium]|nr:hypothetical protein [Gemmatimonadota bacterium]